MSLPFPEPTRPIDDLRDVLLGYLAFYRSVLLDKLDGLDDEALRGSTLSSGWSPLELLNHLTHVERRWLEWGFEGRDVDDPWGDSRDGRWHVEPDEQAERSEAVVRAHDLAETGAPGERWEGEHRWRSAASCYTSSRSTPATSGTSTSCASWPTDAQASVDPSEAF